MAMTANKTTGKAVADIKALYFLKHGATEPVITDSLESVDWFPVLSLRGTVNATQDAPSIEKINVDQFDAAIGITAEPGDFTFEAQLPSLAKADIEKWLGAEVQATGKTIDGKEVIGFNLDSTLYEVSVLIQTRTNDTIIFSRAQVAFSFSKEDKVFLFKVTGQVLAPENEANKMIYLATEAAKA